MSELRLTTSPAFKSAIAMILNASRENRLAFVRDMETATDEEFTAVGHALREAFPQHAETVDQLLGTINLMRLQAIKRSDTMSGPAEGTAT